MEFVVFVLSLEKCAFVLKGEISAVLFNLKCKPCAYISGEAYFGKVSFLPRKGELFFEGQY